MKPHIFIISLLIGWSSVACSTTGTDRKMSVPVVGIDCAEAEAEDSILSLIPDTISIAMTGDIMMGTAYPKPALPPDNGRMLFKDVKHILSNADIAVATWRERYATALKQRRRNQNSTIRSAHL